MTPPLEAVVFDLFGTLVDAPTPAERIAAATRLAKTVGCGTEVVDQYLQASWKARHNGALPSLRSLASDLVGRCSGDPAAVDRVMRELLHLARSRLTADVSVINVLARLRVDGLRIGVMSDASAEIAAAWPSSAIAAHVDEVLFSCSAGCVKPDPKLYGQISHRLGSAPARTLYCGDGGGDELHGAQRSGMAPVGVHRRGDAGALAYGAAAWHGVTIDSVEQLPEYLAEIR